MWVGRGTLCIIKLIQKKTNYLPTQNFNSMLYEQTIDLLRPQSIIMNHSQMKSPNNMAKIESHVNFCSNVPMWLKIRLKMQYLMELKLVQSFKMCHISINFGNKYWMICSFRKNRFWFEHVIFHHPSSSAIVIICVDSPLNAELLIGFELTAKQKRASYQRRNLVVAAL